MDTHPMQTAPTPVRWDIFLAICILLAFTALNIYDATHLQLWYDEGWTLTEITGVLTADGLQLPVGGPHPGQTFVDAVAQPGPFADVAGGLYAHDVHPPLYFQALWAWAHIFGTSPLGMRALSIVCMCASAALIFWHSRRTTGPAAVLALTLMLSSPGAAYAAVNARGYGLGLLLVSIAIVGMLRAVEGTKPTPWMALAGTALGAATLTHYFAVLTLMPAGMATLAFLGQQRQWKAMAMGMVTAAPWLAVVGWVWLPHHLVARQEQYAGFNTWAVELISLYRVFVNQFTPYAIDNIAFGAALSIAGAMVLAAFLRLGFHKRAHPSVVIPFAGFFGCLLGLLVLFWATDKTLLAFSVPRYGVLAIPSMALLLAQLPTPAGARHRTLITASAIALAAMGVWPRMQGATFDQPWANHRPTHNAALNLAQAPDPTNSLVAIIGTEPGQTGTMLHTLPPRMPVVHIPTAQHLTDVLGTASPHTLYMRPVPWKLPNNKPFFSQAVLDAARAAGYTQIDLMTWKKDTPAQ